MASNGMRIRHGGTFQCLNGSVEGGSIIAVGGADTKNRDKQMEFAAINEGQEFEEEHARVDGHARGRGSDKEWNRVRKDGIERNLGVEKVERSEIGGSGSTSSGEDGLHFRR
jgi:hypothetical protein